MKRVLGKGIESLIPNQEPEEGFKFIKVGMIEPNKYQMRKDFDRESIDELARSIEENGIVQPLLVTRKGKKYMLIAGERRWRAAKKAGLEAVPCVERTLEEQDSLMVSLIENIQREDLSPIEEASAYKQLADEFSLTQEKISKKVGKSRSAVANSLRILTLPADLKEMVGAGKLSSGHARALLSLKDPKKRKALALKITREKLTVREAEKLVSADKKKKKKKTSASKSSSLNNPEIEKFRNRFEKALGTKVDIKLKGKDSESRGELKVEFYSLEDFERIADVICGG
ncbi:MAG: ParB/RepB/Spo0J family partition protein [Elusimicrobiota bacterium]